ARRGADLSADQRAQRDASGARESIEEGGLDGGARRRRRGEHRIEHFAEYTFEWKIKAYSRSEKVRRRLGDRSEQLRLIFTRDGRQRSGLAQPGRLARRAVLREHQRHERGARDVDATGGDDEGTHEEHRERESGAPPN